MIERRPGPLTDPDLELLSRFDLGPEAWALLPAETCQRLSMLVVDRVQTRVEALPEQTRKIRLPDPEAALSLPIERRTANTLRREARRGAPGPWTVERYVGLRRFGGRALVDLLSAIEASGLVAAEGLEPPTSVAAGGILSERALDASLALVAKHLPISEERAQHELVRAGLSAGPVDVGDLARLAVRLGRNAPFHIIDVGGTRVIVRLADVTAARASYRIALRTVQGWGSATIRAVASQVRAAVHAVVEASFVEQMLIGLSAFRWLDRRDGWFWFAQRRNPILTDVGKVFSVATRLPFLRLWNAVFRLRPGPPPSAEAVRQICEAIPGAHLNDDVVMVDRAFDRTAHLTTVEDQIARMIETSGVGVSDSQLKKMARAVGLPWTTVWRLLRSSPVFERAPTGLYTLIGSAG